MTSPTSPASNAPRPSRVNGLHWIGGVVALGVAIWYWSQFSGPFRWLVDLQVRLTGRYYWEPLAMAMLLGALLCVAALLADVLDPIARRIFTRHWVVLVFIVAVGLTAVAFVRAWHLWNAPETGATRKFPPVRALDVDTLGTERLPRGLVRVVGKADRKLQVKLHQEPRGYHVYQPVGGMTRAASELPVPVLAFCWDRYGRDCIDEKLDGWLLPDGIGGRDLYRLRRAGVLTDGPHYLLLPGLPTRDEYTEAGPGDPGEAVAIVLFTGLLWFTVIFSWIKSPPGPLDAPRVKTVDESTAAPRAALYLAALFFAAGVFVLLSVLGMLRWFFELLPF